MSPTNRPFALTVNGVSQTLSVPLEASLLHVLRNDLGLNGPKYGCGLGQCGACTVLVDGVAARACVIPAAGVAGRTITTLEGLSNANGLHAVQQAFIDAQAAQCGYCLSGVILTAKATLDQNPKASDAQLEQALSTVLCRCFTHTRMWAAIKKYAGRTA